MEKKFYRNVCPRNCYGTCSMISEVKNGKLVKVSGDPINTYTAGRLCAKGYAYTQYVYSPNRLKHPLRQYPRGSGNWERITWEQAMDQIGEKVLELYDRHGSNLAVAYNKFSGNLGFLHQAVEGMFNAIGPHTSPSGNPCLAAGWDALLYDFGSLTQLPDPETMVHAKNIVIWGANPAWTAVHQLKFINQARDNGAKLIVIDPLFTATAAQADIFFQIKPGTDGMLALAAAKILLERGEICCDHNQPGWQSFLSYLKDVDIKEASRITGLAEEGIRELAESYLVYPCVTWIGYGMQRHTNGGQNMRAINALVALSGNLYSSEGGLFFFQPWSDFFPSNLLKLSHPERMGENRKININNFAYEALNLDDPPVKMLYVACRNPLSQDQNLKEWKKFIPQLELMVTTDLFMTKTAEMSDIVLPAASHFEDYDLNVGYWHNWLGLNQKAIEPWYEAKSDLEIARLLTRSLNEKRAGFSAFPAELTALDWIEKEMSPEILKAYGLKDWQELFDGPQKIKDYAQFNLKKSLETGDYEVFSQTAKANNLPAIAKYCEELKESDFSLRLLTPQSSTRLHSQFSALDWLAEENSELVLEMNEWDAQSRKIEDGDRVQLGNDYEKIACRVRISPAVPPGSVVMAQAGDRPVNQLFSQLRTDMGAKNTGSQGIAFYDAYVDVRKYSEDGGRAVFD